MSIKVLQGQVEQSLQHALLAEQYTQLTLENQRLTTQAAYLQEQLNLALARRYAARSEVSPDQIRLFDEAEVEGTPAGEPAEEVPAPIPTTVVGHTRKRAGRKPLPEALPRVVVRHTLPEIRAHLPTRWTPLDRDRGGHERAA